MIIEHLLLIERSWTLNILAREFPTKSIIRALHFWQEDRISIDYRTYLICESECAHIMYRWKFFENLSAQKLEVIERIYGEWMYILYQLSKEEDMPGCILCFRAREQIVLSLLVLIQLDVWDILNIHRMIMHLMCYDRE